MTDFRDNARVQLSDSVFPVDICNPPPPRTENTCLSLFRLRKTDPLHFEIVRPSRLNLNHIIQCTISRTARSNRRTRKEKVNINVSMFNKGFIILLHGIIFIRFSVRTKVLNVKQCVGSVSRIFFWSASKFVNRDAGANLREVAPIVCRTLWGYWTACKT